MDTLFSEIVVGLLTVGVGWLVKRAATFLGIKNKEAARNVVVSSAVRIIRETQADVKAGVLIADGYEKLEKSAERWLDAHTPKEISKAFDLVGITEDNVKIGAMRLVQGAFESAFPGVLKQKGGGA